jgi:hypothetical protein
MKENKVLEFEEEAYVVPGMNVPILLGEDFQGNYDVSVLRKDGSVEVTVDRDGAQHRIPASNALELDRGFEVHHVKAEFLQNRKVKEIMKTGKEEGRQPKPQVSTEPSYARAAQDVEIKPSLCKVLIVGEFGKCEVWIVDQLTIGMKDGDFYGTAMSLVGSKDPFIHVANVMSKSRIICKGKILGILLDPNLYWDSKSTAEEDKHCIAFVNIIHKLAKGSAAEHENLQKPLKFPDQPFEELSSLESETNWGPKTAETPEVKTYASTDIESIIDIAPDVPSDIHK